MKELDTMAKKDNMKDALNYAGKNASGKLHQATGNRGTQEEASPEEKLMRQQDGRTQGRLGCKMPRINMAFVPSNINYLRDLAKDTGITQTRLCNAILEIYRKEHPEPTKEGNADLLQLVAEKYTYERYSEIMDN